MFECSIFTYTSTYSLPRIMILIHLYCGTTPLFLVAIHLDAWASNVILKYFLRLINCLRSGFESEGKFKKLTNYQVSAFTRRLHYFSMTLFNYIVPMCYGN